MKNITFASRVCIDWASVKKHMPSQQNNLGNAGITLYENGENNDVFIQAKAPYLVEMKIVKPHNSPITLCAVDPRPMDAMNKKMSKENWQYLFGDEITPELQENIDTEYQKDLDRIKRMPFDFEQEIIDVYSKSQE